MDLVETNFEHQVQAEFLEVFRGIEKRSQTISQGSRSSGETLLIIKASTSCITSVSNSSTTLFRNVQARTLESGNRLRVQSRG